MNRLINTVMCIGCMLLFLTPVEAQIAVGTESSRDMGVDESTEFFTSTDGLPAKPGDTEEQSADKAPVWTIRKKIEYTASELDNQLSSQIIAKEQAKRHFIEELSDDIMDYYSEQYAIENDKEPLVREYISPLLPCLIQIETSNETWGNNQLSLEATTQVSSSGIARSIFQILNEKMLLKHIIRNRESADSAFAKIKKLQIAPSGNMTENLESYNQAVNQLHAADWFEKAIFSGFSGDTQSAIDAYSKAVECNPKFAEAFYYRGTYYQNFSKDPQKALSDYCQAIELDNSEPRYFTSRGICYYQLNNLELAIKDLSRGIELDPASQATYGALAVRGSIYETQGENQKALEDYSRAVEINPEAGAIHYRKGLINRRLKHYEQCIEDFGNAIKLDDSNPDAYYERAIAYAFLRDNKYKQQVLNDFKAAAKLGHVEAQKFLEDHNIQW